MLTINLRIFCLTLMWTAVIGEFIETIIPQGTLKGMYKKTWTGKNFASFTGIPYAIPPIGKLRFEAPLPASSWTDVLDATKYQSDCTQNNILMNIYDVSGTEDCLYLNVYTPQISFENNHSLPVMFFTHGGGWIFGSGSDDWYGPEFLLEENIVLVTINYRLGALGFISMGDKVIPGNNGLKDQSLALKWTKNNIAYFGGDPNRITVFGNSAGGASTHYQLISPLTRDLINGAIIQSGTAFGPWALLPTEQARNKSIALANQLGCFSTDSNELLKCLRNRDAKEIINAESTLYEWTYDPVIAFRPVVEHESENAFLPDLPENIIKLGKTAKVPIMLSIVSEDGIIKAGYIFNNSILMDEFSKHFDKIAPFTLLYNNYKDIDVITSKVKNFYFDNHFNRSYTSQLINVVTDSWFLEPLHLSAQMHLEYTKKPVYLLMYNYRSSKTYGDLYGDPHHNYGVCHSDELLNLFTTKLYGIYHKSSTEIKAVKTVTKLWTNFAKTGNPTPNDDELPKWELTEKEKSKFYYINNNIDMKMINNPSIDRILFWNEIRKHHTKENK